MGWGLTVNGMYLPRVHMHGVRDAVEEADYALDIHRKALVALAAATPAMGADSTMGELAGEIAAAVDECVDGIVEAAQTGLLAQHAIDNPGDCLDE